MTTTEYFGRSRASSTFTVAVSLAPASGLTTFADVEAEFPGQNFYEDLIAIDVDIDIELGSRYLIELVLKDTTLPNWIDSFGSKIGNVIMIEIGFAGAADTELVRGPITGVTSHITRDPSTSRVTIEGLDLSAHLDRLDKQVAHDQQTDSAIADVVLGPSGLLNNISDTSEQSWPRSPHSTIVMQSETDLQFLRRLARRNGFVFRVDGRTAYFGPRKMALAPANPILASDPREDSNVEEIYFSADTTRPKAVYASRVDLDLATPVVKLHRNTSASLNGSLVSSDQNVEIMQSVPAERMRAALTAQASYRDEFVVCRCAIDGLGLKGVVRVGRDQVMERAGTHFNGTYLTNHVRHSLREGSYTQYMQATKGDFGI